MLKKNMPKERQIAIEGLTIAAKCWGDKTLPPMIALHGWLDNAASFDLLAPLLCEHFHLIAVDLPGHGLSSHLAPGCYYHFIDAVFVLHQIIDALGYPQVHLSGHSMGACLASLAAGIFPDYCLSMVLIDALGPLSRPGETAPQQMRDYLNRYQSDFLRREKPYATMKDAAKARAQKGYLDEEIAEILCTRGLREQDGQFYWRHDKRLLLPSPLRLTEEQVLACLKQIKTPTLLIEPEQGFAFDSEIYKERVRQVKALRIEKITGGHHVHLEKPQQVAELILNYLQAL